MTTSAGPTVELELQWSGDLRFAGRTADAALVLDSDGRAGPSPVQTLCFALAGCMAMDVVHILKKGRQPVTGLTVRLGARRAATEPRRVLAVDLKFTVQGGAAADKVDRAIALSREKYCSVWHSLSQDIDLVTSFELRP